jgi:U32 family peptidase
MTKIGVYFPARLILITHPMEDKRTGKKSLPELLAPAGSPESLRAAIAAGADAVYLSGKRFGARKYAANFSEDEIQEGIRLAHTCGVRIYVTVNTLIHDRELKGVAEYLIWLYAAGVDAVLVQDTGVVSLAREIVPDLPVHASTQMTIHNTGGVLWAAEQGFSRVVLPRELPLDEIRRIADKTSTTGVGLEVFAHGALCYSYSGQCLLSSVIGGRSGNRGMCAQPCRKPYTLVTGGQDEYGRPELLRDMETPGNYLLSPKDLCTYRQLPELVKAPVVSLKIEGRMKSPEYVAIVVSAYRRALDAIAAGNWKPVPEVERDLLLAFNRGFTRGYLFGDRHAALMARDAPDNRGICIGTVAKQDERNGTVTVHLNNTLIPATGDGLLFTDPAKCREDWGFSLNNTPVVKDKRTVTFSVPRPVAPGSAIYLTSSRDLETRARRIIAHPPADLVHKIFVDLSITIDADGRISIDGRLESGSGKEVRVSYQADFCLAPARSRPLLRDQLEVQLRKSGDTPFVVRNCSISYDGTLFAPVSELNRMRRVFLARAEEALLASSIPSDEDIVRSRQRLAVAFPEYPSAPVPGRDSAVSANPLALTVYADTLEAVSMAVKEGCTSICFEPAFVLPRHSCPGGKNMDFRSVRKQVAEAMAVCRDAGARFVLKLPRITRDDYLSAVLPEIALLHKDGLGECRVENTGTAYAVQKLIPDMILSSAAGLNIFNHRSACHLSPPFRSFTLSPELSRDECRDLVRAARRGNCKASFTFMVQGVSDAMITEDCIAEPVRHCREARDDGAGNAFTGIQDATGRVFPIHTDGECRTHIGNAAEICLIDYLPVIRQAGISEVVIDTRGRTGIYAGVMTQIYRKATDLVNNGAFLENQVISLKDRIKTHAFGGITTGHFLRGLKE